MANRDDISATVERLLDELERRQGLPRHVEDPVVLARVAAIILEARADPAVTMSPPENRRSP